MLLLLRFIEIADQPEYYNDPVDWQTFFEQPQDKKSNEKVAEGKRHSEAAKRAKDNEVGV